MVILYIKFWKYVIELSFFSYRVLIFVIVIETKNILQILFKSCHTKRSCDNILYNVIWNIKFLTYCMWHALRTYRDTPFLRPRQLYCHTSS